MQRCWKLALALALAVWGCEEDPPPPARLQRAGADAAADADGSRGDADAPAPRQPVTVPAAVEHPAPRLGACFALEADEPRFPQLFAARGRLFAFYVDGSGEAAPLVLRTAVAPDGEFGEPQTLLHGARRVDLVDDDGTLRVLAARQFYVVPLSSADGVGWTEHANVAPDEPTYNCEGYPPAHWFRGRSPLRLLAMGSDYNTGIFGCQDRVFVGRRDGDGWLTPTQAGSGDAVFAFDGEQRQVLVSTHGVYVSSDDGESFTEARDGDTTATQLRGSGGSVVGGRLALVQAYEYANEYVVALRFSANEGESWDDPVALWRDTELTFVAPTLAADGDTLAVAHAVAGELWLAASADAGRTWSETLRAPLSDAVVALAVTGGTAAWMASGDTLQVCTAALR